MWCVPWLLSSNEWVPHLAQTFSISQISLVNFPSTIPFAIHFLSFIAQLPLTRIVVLILRVIENSPVAWSFLDLCPLIELKDSSFFANYSPCSTLTERERERKRWGRDNWIISICCMRSRVMSLFVTIFSLKVYWTWQLGKEVSENYITECMEENAFRGEQVACIARDI